MEKVLGGEAGRERGNKGEGYILSKSMKKEQLSRDCNGRYLQNDGLLKPALETQYREDKKGIQRVLAHST